MNDNGNCSCQLYGIFCMKSAFICRNVQVISEVFPFVKTWINFVEFEDEKCLCNIFPGNYVWEDTETGVYQNGNACLFLMAIFWAHNYSKNASSVAIFFRGSSLLSWWIPRINSATFTWTSSQRSLLPLLWRQRRHDSYDKEKNEKLKTT